MPVIDVASQSIQNIGQGASPPEIYEELWWYSGNLTLSTSNTTPSNTILLTKGNTSYGVNSVLFTNNFSANQLFAFEIALLSNAYPVYSALWDLTSNVLVNNSQVSDNIANGTVNIIRSSQFLLVPNHQYGIAVWSGGSQWVRATDASLIIFPQ